MSGKLRFQTDLNAKFPCQLVTDLAGRVQQNNILLDASHLLFPDSSFPLQSAFQCIPPQVTYTVMWHNKQVMSVIFTKQRHPDVTFVAADVCIVHSYSGSDSSSNMYKWIWEVDIWSEGQKEVKSCYYLFVCIEPARTEWAHREGGPKETGTKTAWFRQAELTGCMKSQYKMNKECFEL